MSKPQTVEQDKKPVGAPVAVTEEEYALSLHEFFAMSRRLEQHHAVFYQLWELGRPHFTRLIPTAAVRFNGEGHCIEFMFNPDFWKELSDEQREFVIAHECMHVILKHGLRAKDASKEERHAVNVAMDVIVNQILLTQFGFDRDDIDPEHKYCWLDTVWTDKSKPAFKDIEANESFEYYYNRLPEEAFAGLGGYILVDIHDFLDGSESDAAIDSLNDSLSPEDKETLKKAIQKQLESDKISKNRGSEAGSSWKFMDTKPVVPKRKWETVIKKWATPFIKNDFDYFEHWARVNRRLVELPQEIVLPTEMELQDKEDEGKIKVYFFLDTSGSCAGLAPRFWAAAKSLPKDRFEKRLFCFDTKVYDVDEKVGKLYGFGGTSFHIIEDRILSEMKTAKDPKEQKYPKAVFVITDGYGTHVNPKLPKNWYWFLSEGGSDYCIPKECHKFWLKDYE